MGHGQDGGPRLGRLIEQQIEDPGLGRGIEIAGRLVRQDQPGLRHKRPADGHALLFALAQPGGVPVQLVADAAGRRQRLGPLADGVIERQNRVNPERIEDVLRAVR